jgi:hypothetical protein
VVPSSHGELASCKGNNRCRIEPETNEVKMEDS